MAIPPRFTKRLHKELRNMRFNAPAGIRVRNCDNITKWTLDVIGVEGTIYAGEMFKLYLDFNVNFPFESPIVFFIGKNIPVHPHIYSNGHICLSTLYGDWTPAMTVSTLVLSIISMMSNCKEKTRPLDNDNYIKKCSKNPKKTNWKFHDDKA